MGPPVCSLASLPSLLNAPRLHIASPPPPPPSPPPSPLAPFDFSSPERLSCCDMTVIWHHLAQPGLCHDMPGWWRGFRAWRRAQHIQTRCGDAKAEGLFWTRMNHLNMMMGGGGFLPTDWCYRKVPQLHLHPSNSGSFLLNSSVIMRDDHVFINAVCTLAFLIIGPRLCFFCCFF